MAIFGVALVSGVVLYLLICVLTYVLQPRLILEPYQGLKKNPGLLGYRYEDVWIPIPGTSDQIHGWWIPVNNPTAPVMLYLHGNSGTISYFSYLIPLWNQLGFHLLMVDYRGFGLSSSDRFPNEQRLYEDADAALTYLLDDRGIAPEKIVVYGFSLGGAIALDVLCRRSQAFGGLVVEGTFTGMRQMAEFISTISRWRKYNWLPLQWLIHQRFDSLSKLPSLQTPLLILHGENDTTVPVTMAQQLFQACPSPKQLTIIPQVDHLDLVEGATEIYLDTLRQFFHTHALGTIAKALGQPSSKA